MVDAMHHKIRLLVCLILGAFPYSMALAADPWANSKCTAEFETYCLLSNTTPYKCLQQHESQLSVSCLGDLYDDIGGSDALGSPQKTRAVSTYDPYGSLKEQVRAYQGSSDSVLSGRTFSGSSLPSELSLSQLYRQPTGQQPQSGKEMTSLSPQRSPSYSVSGLNSSNLFGTNSSPGFFSANRTPNSILNGSRNLMSDTKPPQNPNAPEVMYDPYVGLRHELKDYKTSYIKSGIELPKFSLDLDEEDESRAKTQLLRNRMKPTYYTEDDINDPNIQEMYNAETTNDYLRRIENQP